MADRPPEWPGYEAGVEDNERNQRLVTLDTRHGSCKHFCKAVLDLHWAQTDANYVDYVIDQMKHELDRAIEECGRG